LWRIRANSDAKLHITTILSTAVSENRTVFGNIERIPVVLEHPEEEKRVFPSF
jgi:hypothetical protein